MKSNKKVRAAEAVSRRLEPDILNKVLKPGDKLPAERDLQNELGVSRWTIREAYRILCQKGLVEIKGGGGTFVSEVDNHLAGTTIHTLIRQGAISLEHLQEFRETVDVQCAALAVERATKDQIQELKLLFKKLQARYEAHGDDFEFYQLELRLHSAIAKMTSNPLFEWFTETFQKYLADFGRLQFGCSETSHEALSDWKQFVQALDNGEGQKSSMIIEHHILKFKRILARFAKP